MICICIPYKKEIHINVLSFLIDLNNKFQTETFSVNVFLYLTVYTNSHTDNFTKTNRLEY